jgi:hypothetical protein
MTERYPISSSSPKLFQVGRKYDYPFNSLQIGQSFPIKKDEVKLETLRSIVSKAGKKLEMKFRVISHDECYEVGRIA